MTCKQRDKLAYTLLIDIGVVAAIIGIFLLFVNNVVIQLTGFFLCAPQLVVTAPLGKRFKSKLKYYGADENEYRKPERGPYMDVKQHLEKEKYL